MAGREHRLGARQALVLYMLALGLVAWSFMPPIMDFPNHLTRIWLLSGGARMAPLNEFYAVDWAQASTNVTVDAVAAVLARLLPIFLVSKLLVACLILGPPAAAAYLNRRVFGTYSLWSAAPLLFAWTTTSVAGFLSFQISLMTAFLCATAMLSLWSGRRTAVAIAMHGVFSLLLLTIHPFGLLLYLAILCGLIIGPELPAQPSWRWVRGKVLLICGTAAVGLILVIALFVLTPHPPGGSTGIVWVPSFPSKFAPFEIARTLFSPFIGYDKIIDLTFAAMFLLVCAGIAVRRGFDAHAGLVMVAIGLACLSVIMPSAIGDASWLERRVPIMTVLVAVASVRARMVGSGAWRYLLFVLPLVVLCRMAWIASIWASRDGDGRLLLSAARSIPAGSRVLLLRTPENKQNALPTGRLVAGEPYHALEFTSRHLGTLLVITNHVFVPTLFSISGQQPLTIRASYLPLSVRSSRTPTTAELVSGLTQDRYVIGWRCHFDYVVISDLDQGGYIPVLAGTQAVSRTRFAMVARVQRPAYCGGEVSEH